MIVKYTHEAYSTKTFNTAAKSVIVGEEQSSGCRVTEK